YVEIVKESCGKKQGQYGLVIYGLSSIHDAKINNNIGLLKTQQYYLIRQSTERKVGLQLRQRERGADKR
ncbi:hypothetical protein, partial [Leyella stercorea]|uniref:hypothetical protein n=1 Tax=Leyella stercorea TaxID=363265 RepID=UPI003AEF2CD9